MRIEGWYCPIHIFKKERKYDEAVQQIGSIWTREYSSLEDFHRRENPSDDQLLFYREVDEKS